MVLNYRKHQPNITKDILKDGRGEWAQINDKLRKPPIAGSVFMMCGLLVAIIPFFVHIAEFLLFFCIGYFLWLHRKPQNLPFKMPKTANRLDPNNKGPAGGGARKSDGILFLGNDAETGQEIWFNNDDARTHILYLGTTGSGKTEGLKTIAANALGWGSGFIYIDGKADTDLWGLLSALARRFGRDDDLLVLNYMTGNSDKNAVSNSINPFALGSASYLTNLLVSLMPDVQGDNAMWKDRAVALMSALMPVLTWKRDELEIPLSINVIRDELLMSNVISLSRDSKVPEKIRREIKGYLASLPGYRDEFYNDDGSPRAGPNGQPNDTSTTEQQHGYLTMQFTRQLQSLAGDYGYIFLNPHADIDIMDVVLNRRMLVALIPALEKSADETANLGKIIGSLLKGMMGSTLGSTVEGDTDMALENRPTRSQTPFISIFDEVGYYTTQGMAVMAAQARSLGFCLVFAGQDLPALEKRIKEEARSITANCNIKIFGKLEDPTQTKEFFEKTVGKALVLESGGRKQVKTIFGSKMYEDSDSYSVQSREKADYDDLKGYRSGEAVVCFGDHLVKAKMHYSNPGKIKSLRVNRFIALEHPDPAGKRGSRDVEAVLERFRDKEWTAENAQDQHEPHAVLKSLAEGFAQAREQQRNLVESGAYALTWMAWEEEHLKKEDIPDPAVQKEKAAAIETPAAPSLQAPNEAVAPTLAVPATEPLVSAVPELRATEPATPPAVMKTPETLKAPPSPPPVVAKKDDDDDADDRINKATEDSLSWAALLGEEAPAKKANADDEIDPENSSEETQESIRKGTQETISWDKLLGEDDSSETPKKATVPAAAAGAIPQTSFGYGGYGGISGISYGVPSALPTGAATPAVPEKVSATLKKDGLETTEKKADATDKDDGNGTLKWDDLI
jgi:intracellular multiplication protein IcmO